MKPNHILVTICGEEIFCAQYAYIEDYQGDPYDTNNVPFAVGSNQYIVALEDAYPKMLELAEQANNEFQWHLGRKQ